MSVLQIGRFESSVGPEPVWSGDSVTFEGDIIEATVALTLLRRDQLLALAGDDDEPVVNVVFTPDPSIDGFYTVDGVPSVGWTEGVQLTDGTPMPYSITLTKVPSFANARSETAVVSVIRTNSHLVTSGTAIVGAFPSDDARDYAVGTDVAVASWTRSGEDGALSIVTAAPTSSTPIGPAAGQAWFASALAPENHHRGAVTLEISDGAGNWLPWPGRQVPSGSDWRISNGLIRVTGSGISVYKSGAWQTPIPFAVGRYTGGVYGWGRAIGTDYQTGLINIPPAVLLNSRGKVALKWDIAPQKTLATIPGTTVLSLRAGCHHAEIAVTGQSSNWAVTGDPNVAGTAITGGVRATSPNAAGDRWVVACPSAVTSSVGVPTGIRLTSAATSAVFMVGAEVGGSGAAANDTAAKLVEQFLAYSSAETRLVGR